MNIIFLAYRSLQLTGIGNRSSGVLLLVMMASLLNAQQSPLVTQYMFNNMAINPAYAGASEGICATGLVRQQWIGFKDPEGNKVAPETMFLTVDAPIKVLHGAVGGSIMQDKLGFFRTIDLKLGYAYRFDLGPGDMSAGLQVDLNNTKIDFSKFKPLHEDDPLLADKAENSDLVFDLSLGLFYKVPDKFYVGLSADNLLQSKAKKLYYTLKRNYYITGGYNWIIPGHPVFELQPSVILRTDLAAFQFDISGLVIYNKKIWGGLSYRYQDAVSVLAGINFKGIRVGLAYDISTSALTKYNSGSIEIMASYCFKLAADKFRKSYKNTRFL